MENDTMRTYSFGFRVTTWAVVALFAWSYGPLFQIPTALAAEKQKTDAGTQKANGSRPDKTGTQEPRPEEKFEKAVEAIREKAGKAGEKEAKGEDDSAEIEAIKAKKTEIESLDLELKKEFAGTEQRLKAAKLPKEILARHAAFVEHYTSNVNSLRKELDDIDSAKTTADRKAKIEKVRLHLEKVKAPSRHQKLDPENLPFKARKITKTREPRLDKKSFERDFPQQKTLRPGSGQAPNKRKLADALFLPDLPASKPHSKPVLLAFNEAASDIPFSYGTQPSAPQLAFSDSAPIILSQTAIQPIPDDLAETPEVQFTPAIRDLAAQLGNKPNRILEWVQNNIEFVPTYSSIQGADMCLQSRQCNAYDTNSLLISLLRVSNLPAHFVYGTIEIPINKVMNWAGGFSDPRAAVNFIASGGIPIKPYVSGGVITKVQMEHVWVETYIPYGNYRGAIMDQSLKTWIPMDGSFKQYTYTSGFDITAKVAFDQNAYLSKAQSQNPVHYYQSQIQNYLDVNMPDKSIVDVKGYREITQETYHFLPSTLPYITVAQLGTFSSIPDGMTAKVTFTVTNPSTGSAVSYTAATAQLAGKRLTVSYIPATSADEALIAIYGGFLYDVPAYMLNLKAVLRVEGVIKLTGEATTLGAEQTLTMQFVQPASSMNETVNKKLIAGAYYAVEMDLQGINESVLGKRNYQLTTNVLTQTAGTLGNDDLIGEYLYIRAIMYFLSNDKLYKSGGKLYNTAITRTISEGITSTPLTVSYVFSVPKAATLSGVEIDVAMDRIIAIAKDGNVSREKAYMDISGLTSSYDEHDVFEKLDEFPSVSAVRALQTAAANSIPIFTVNIANIAQLLPTIQVNAEIKQEIQNAINAGKEVTIPQTNVKIGDWLGVGYIVKDPITGSGAYRISGGLGGALTAMIVVGTAIVALYKGPYGWIKDRLDPQTRRNIVTAAEIEIGETIAENVGSISNYEPGYGDVGQCSGLVRLAYWTAGICLDNVAPPYGVKCGNSLASKYHISGGNGVAIHYSLADTLKLNNSVRTTNDPLLGDIVFFNNTTGPGHPRNHEGIVVTEPDAQGTVEFIHATGSQGVHNSNMNIMSPADKNMNSFIGDPARCGSSCRSGQLFSGYGTIRDR